MVKPCDIDNCQSIMISGQNWFPSLYYGFIAYLLLFLLVVDATDPHVPCYTGVDDCSDNVTVFTATIYNCCVTHNAMSYYNMYPTNGTAVSCLPCPGMLNQLNIHIIAMYYAM